MHKRMKSCCESEKYLNVLPTNLSQYLCWFRTSNHRLPVETGRWINIDYNHRKCDMCSSNEIGDEYHVILECPALKDSRTNYIPDYLTRYQSDHKFDSLMRISEHSKLTTNIAKFVREIFRQRKKLKTLL